MFSWLSAGTPAAACAVEIADWTALILHDLRAELHLSQTETLGFNFSDLPCVIVPDEFQGRLHDDETRDQLLLEAAFDFFSNLRLQLPHARFLFLVNCVCTRPMLVRVRGTSVDVTVVGLWAYEASGALRAHQCRALHTRTGACVIEQIASSRGDLRQPSAAQCVIGLLGDHAAAGAATAAPAPGAAAESSLAERAIKCDVPGFLRATKRESSVFTSGQALTGLFYLYLCDKRNIAVCNELFEEAVRFAQRLTADNGPVELAKLAQRSVAYPARLCGCSISVAQVVSIVRATSRHLFGSDVHR